MRLLSLFLVAMGTVFGGCVRPSAEMTYPCYRLAAVPTIDGVVDADPAWATIPEEAGFVTPFVETFGIHYPSSQRSAFRIGYDSVSLCVAVECEEPWIRYLKGNRPPEEEFTKDDGIELFLRSAHDGPIHHFVVNARGARWNEKTSGDGPMALSSWNASVVMGEASYTIEMAIPFAALGATPTAGDEWEMNVARNMISIHCPEDHMTSWSPVQSAFDEAEHFGTLVFHPNTLSVDEAAEQEQRLAASASRRLRERREMLEQHEAREEELAAAYARDVRRAGRGLTGVSRGDADLVEPPGAPAGEVWRYGLGFPMQISPTEAALLVNVRMEGSGNIDFEIGSDVVIFDDLETITAERALPVSRYERGVDPIGGPFIVRKGPILGGFVPLGAVLPDGSPHPHAGSGFGMCWAIRHDLDEQGQFNYLKIRERYAIVFQFAYDGKTFTVRRREPVDAAALLPDWRLAGNFVTNAIPDGDDLLYVMIARVGAVAVAGVTRWVCQDERWRPVSFVPVTGTEATWSEPSLVREPDGSLLFSARSADRAHSSIAFDVAVWQSRDNGRSWTQVLYEKHRRARSPVSINRAVDGTPYIAGNTPPLRRTREVLTLWPINPSRTALVCSIVARDAPSEFGPAPSGSWWRIDHPTSAIIRLRDGRWHNILAYRIVDNGEVEGSAPPAPQTGCYVEEVFSAGPPSPMWIFSRP